MAEKVVALPGFKVPVPQGEPVPDLVARLEHLLEKAKCGQLLAIAYGVVESNGSQIPGQWCSGSGWVHGAGSKNDMMVAVAMLEFRLKRSLIEGED